MKLIANILILILSGNAWSGDKSSSTYSILPLPDAPSLNIDKVAIGERLFSDPILSNNQGMSCSSCHNLKAGGGDNKSFSTTMSGTQRNINTPTVFNSTYNIAFTWTGKHTQIKSLFLGLLTSPTALNGNVETLLMLLKSHPTYQTQFKNAYHDGVTLDNVLDALVQFQKQLTTPNARFDQYLKGDLDAISKQEKQGFILFKSYGCISCHQGVNIGGNLYQKLGLFDDYLAKRGTKILARDYGRFNHTNVQRDKHYFRVPSLRNVTETGPYLHDGSIEDLDDVVKMMGRVQLGKKIPAEDREDIIAFLRTLTGQYKEQYLDAKN